MTNDQRTTSHNLRRPLTSYTPPPYDTTVLTSALANPYPQHYASHYYQAYFQALPPRTTSDGYTLSSTYVPGAENQTARVPLPLPTTDRPSTQAHPQLVAKPILNHLTHGTWYQPGNYQCARKGCPFSGSRKSVEIHMMDRHFVFPPGWEDKDEWDADPSLRGKPVVISGTSVVLDTPEAVDAWIAERKRRFPTDERIRDKKRKLEEAVARGQLTRDGLGAGARKKYGRSTTLSEGGVKNSRRCQEHQRGRGRRWQGVPHRKEARTQIAGDVTNYAKTEYARETSPNSGSIADDDEAPEVVSSKTPILLPCMPSVDAECVDAGQRSQARPQERVKRIPLPKKPPRNPFASRSTLLRNLLLPEIRITVSNLSQAVHFLVENDFLRNVELHPGEAQERMIEVLTPSETLCSAQLSFPELSQDVD